MLHLHSKAFKWESASPAGFSLLPIVVPIEPHKRNIDFFFLALEVEVSQIQIESFLDKTKLTTSLMKIRKMIIVINLL